MQGILDRYQQIQPKIIFSETEVVWAGKSFDVVPKVAEVARALDAHGLQRVVLLPSVASGRDLPVKQLANVPKRSATDSLSPLTNCLRLTPSLVQHDDDSVLGDWRKHPVSFRATAV